MNNSDKLLKGEENSTILLSSDDLNKWHEIFQTCKSKLNKIQGNYTCSQINEVIGLVKEMLDFNIRFKNSNDQQQSQLEKQSFRLKGQQSEFQRLQEQNQRLQEESQKIKQQNRRTIEQNQRVKKENQQVKKDNQKLKDHMEEIKGLNVENLSKILKDEYQNQMHRLVDDNMIQEDKLAQLMNNHQCDLSFKTISQALQKYKNTIGIEIKAIIDHLEQANITQIMKDCIQIRYQLAYFLNQIDSSNKIMQKASNSFEQRANSNIKEHFYTTKHEIEKVFQKGVIWLIDMASIHCTNCTNCCLKNHEQQSFTFEPMGYDLYQS